MRDLHDKVGGQMIAGNIGRVSFNNITERGVEITRQHINIST